MNQAQYQSETSNLPVPELPLLRLRLNFQALTTTRLPAFQGSTWRGVFGQQLKRTVCVTRLKHCEECELYYRCAHASIFETPIDRQTQKMRRYPHAPHPYIFVLPWHGIRQLETGEDIQIGFNLVGKAINKLPYIIAAMQNIEHSNIGKGNGRLQLQYIEQEAGIGSEQWQSCLDTKQRLHTISTDTRIPPQPDTPLAITFETPLRLAENNRPLSSQCFQPHHLLRNLIRRVSMLSFFHTDKSLETDFVSLNQLARNTPLQQVELSWSDWQRYSNRKQRPIKMGGLRGHFTIESLPRELWPYLWLGQWLHAGKGTVMGLGRYRLAPASLPHRTSVN